MSNAAIPRPFLKWVGGKRQLKDDLIKRMQSQFRNYHEPVVGGGACFFELYRRKTIQRAYISDLNEELIDTYIAVRA